MRQSTTVLALLAGLTLAALLPREAAAEDERIRERVCVYEHTDYRGYEQCFPGGADINDLGRLSNQISSVRIIGRARITLFDYDNFRGRDISITDDVPDLRRFGSFNDQADSLRVSSGGGFRDRGNRGDDRRYDRSSGEDRVCFFEHTQFRGRSECFDLRDDVTDLRASGWNDRISSVRIFGRTRVALFEDVNFGGQRLVIENDIADLTQVSAGRRSWNDLVSSFRISRDRR
jgi:hypothetical protein